MNVSRVRPQVVALTLVLTLIAVFALLRGAYEIAAACTGGLVAALTSLTEDK